MKNILKKSIVVLLAVVLLTGCGKKTTVDSDELKIVTSFYPIYVLTANVVDGVDGVNLVNLTEQQTGCLHDYQVTTQDMKKLENADLFIINGAGMEHFLDKIKENYPELKIIDTSEGIELIESHEGTNPHIWLSIENAIKQLNSINNAVSEIDVDNANLYVKNTTTFTNELTELKNTMINELSGILSRNIVTFHEAFPYFANDLKLDIVSTIEDGENTAHSPKELSEIITAVKDNNVKAIFSEPQYSDKMAQTISDETGVKIYKLDSIVTGELNKEAYVEAMEANLEVLKEALN